MAVKYEYYKKVMAWVFLLVLVTLSLLLSYIKFFSVENTYIEERPVNNSSSVAIHNALEEITTNFNKNPKIEDYAKQNIKLKAVINNYSIYISYITDNTITYEFTYDDLNLNIVVDDSDKDSFNLVYKILIEAVQERLNNEENLEKAINDFLTTDASYDGLSKEKVDAGMKYKINITKKITLS